MTEAGSAVVNATMGGVHPHKGPAGEHNHSHKLEDQAATAALYADKNQGQSDGSRFMDGDKLSSAGAAASLKYAQPRDLPSYPTVGVKDNSAAGAAASLGWANTKSPEYWKPDGTSSSASKAAMLAKDYKAAPLWTPEQSSAGAKAALLAHKDGGKVDIWVPEKDGGAWGNSAANQAMRDGAKVNIWVPEKYGGAWGNSAAVQAMKVGKNNALSPQVDYGYTDLGRQRSLMAATGAMSMSNRKRADSTPIAREPLYPDEANAGANALSAATHAETAGRRSRAEVSEAGAVPYTTMGREMYTSNPPIAADRPEAIEKNRQDVLHASAVAMAKKMYSMQQSQIEATSKAQGQAAASSAHGRRRSNSDSDDEVVPMRFNNLQEAAQRLAQERLAKLHSEHDQNREYRSYYSGNNASQPKSRLSLRGRPVRRASSDGELDDDKAQANKVRAQMSLFNTNLSQVDKHKRQADRDALMAAAQRNVTAKLNGMDEKVARESGRMAPSTLSEWEVKAHTAAQRDSDKRMENHGRINIGGGQFVNQSAVDLVARRNVQPVLDEINEKAEQARVRDAELKLEQEARRRDEENKKTREREVKDINKKLKAQDKEEERLRKQEEKNEKDIKKREEKDAKRLEKETKTKSAEPATTAVVMNTEAADVPESTQSTTSPVVTHDASRTTDRSEAGAGYRADTGMRTSMEMDQADRLDQTISEGQHAGDTPKSPKKASWFKRFSTRRKSKAEGDMEKDGGKPFVGGAALTGAGSTASIHDSVVEPPKNAAAAEAIADDSAEERGRRTERPISPVSSVSSLSREDEAAGESDDEFEEARDNFDEGLAPPPTFGTEKSTSPSRASKFTEVV